MKKIKPFLFILAPLFTFSQKADLKKIELDLLHASNKLYSLDYGSSDSIGKYSEQLRIKTIEAISKNPATLKYPFKMLIDSYAIDIVTSEDGFLRIYSWDTWTGGTMHFYDYIYQFSNNGKVYTDYANLEEGDCGAFYSAIYTLKTNTKIYYLAVSNAGFSSKDKSQSVQVFSIENDQIKQEKLIKTQSGFIDRIDVEFDFFTVVDRPERPLELIKYDKAKQILYIPVVYEDGKVTDKFIQYKFNGKYFEKYKIE